MTTTASAPAKIILLGEHAAVYGKPVLTTALDLRARVTTSLRDDGKIRFIDKKFKIDKTFDPADEPDPEKEPMTSLILHTARKTFGFLNTESGLDIELDSEIPIASGLGSSASIASATVASVSKELGSEPNLQEIAEVAWDSEHLVHSKSSGVDPFTVTFGGFCRYRRGEIEKVDVRDLPEIVVAHTGIDGNTGRLVSFVNERKNKEPEIIEPIIDLVEGITNKGVDAIGKGDWNELGLLMDVNHGLLSALGVSSGELEKLIYAARNAGALGAKLAGAGGGGCMIALCSKEERDSVEDALKRAGGRIIDANVSYEGVVFE